MQKYTTNNKKYMQAKKPQNISVSFVRQRIPVSSLSVIETVNLNSIILEYVINLMLLNFNLIIYMCVYVFYY